MYGKLHQRKLNQQDYVMSCQAVRQQLADYINDEARRVNEDSAKKRAVLQHMDYEGFRQMVLGANLFSIKTKELMKFSEGKDDEPPERILNAALLSFNKESKQTTAIVETSQQCKNYSEFVKSFDKYYKKQLQQNDVEQCYRLLKSQNRDRLLKIFTAQFDPTYLIKIIQVFDFVLMRHVILNHDQNQLIFMVRFLQEIVELPAFKDLILPLLVKSQKLKIKEFLEKVQGQWEKYVDQGNLAHSTLQKLRSGFCL